MLKKLASTALSPVLMATYGSQWLLTSMEPLEIKSENKLSPKEDKVLQKVIDEERSHWQKLISLKNKLKF